MQGKQGLPKPSRGTVPAASAIACATALLAATAGSAAATPRQPGVSVQGNVVRYVAPAPTSAPVDVNSARPMPLPMAPRAPTPQLEAMLAAAPIPGTPGVSAGDPGSRTAKPLMLFEPKTLKQAAPPASNLPPPPEWGLSNHPFTTNRVNIFQRFTASGYPFRAAGQLSFTIGSATYLCSGALIGPGIVVTAAHCVVDYGTATFFSRWTFRPAYNSGQLPYGTWTATNAVVMSSYAFGFDGCAVDGIVCPNDVAVLELIPQNGAYLGGTTGWLSYGWDGYGFNSRNNALITQLGYPVDLDGGKVMQRTDSQAYVDGLSANNSIIGSLQTGGSSGGPWVVNLGIAPKLSRSVRFGEEAERNVVVGVTSWGYIDQAVKQQGASPFTSSNIKILVDAICAEAAPGAC